MSYSLSDLQKLAHNPELLAYFMTPLAREDKRWILLERSLVRMIVGTDTFDPDMAEKARSLYLDMMPDHFEETTTALFSALLHPTRDSVHNRLFGIDGYADFLANWVSTEERMWKRYKALLKSGLVHTLRLVDVLAEYLDYSGWTGSWQFDDDQDPFERIRHQPWRSWVKSIRDTSSRVTRRYFPSSGMNRDERLALIMRKGPSTELEAYSEFFLSEGKPSKSDQIYQDLSLMDRIPYADTQTGDFFDANFFKSLDSFFVFDQLMRGEALIDILSEAQIEMKSRPREMRLLKYGDDAIKVDANPRLDRSLDELALCLCDIPGEIAQILTGYAYLANCGRSVSRIKHNNAFIPPAIVAPSYNLQTIVKSEKVVCYQILEYLDTLDYVFFFFPHEALSLTWLLSDVPGLAENRSCTPVDLGLRVVYSDCGGNIVRMKDPQALSTWSDYYLQGVTHDLDIKYIIQIRVNGFLSTSVHSKYLFFFHDRLWNSYWSSWKVFPKIGDSGDDHMVCQRKYQSYSLSNGKMVKPVELFPFVFGVFIGMDHYQIIVTGETLINFFVGTQSGVGWESEDMVQKDGYKVADPPVLDSFSFCSYIVPVDYYAQNGGEGRKGFSSAKLLDLKLEYNLDKEKGSSLEYSPWEKVRMALIHVVKKYDLKEEEVFPFMNKKKDEPMTLMDIAIMAKLFDEGWNADDLD